MEDYAKAKIIPTGLGTAHSSRDNGWLGGPLILVHSVEIQTEGDSCGSGD